MLVLTTEAANSLIPPAQKFNPHFWYISLYRHVTTFIITDEQFYKVELVLQEAMNKRLIHNAEALLGDMLIANSFQRRHIHKLEVTARAFEASAEGAERRADKIETCMVKYRRLQRLTMVAAMVLQIVPVIGGAIAAVWGAGVSVMRGISVKDVVDYVLYFGKGVAQMVCMRVADDFFARGCGGEMGGLQPQTGNDDKLIVKLEVANIADVDTFIVEKGVVETWSVEKLANCWAAYVVGEDGEEYRKVRDVILNVLNRENVKPYMLVRRVVAHIARKIASLVADTLTIRCRFLSEHRRKLAELFVMKLQ